MALDENNENFKFEKELLELAEFLLGEETDLNSLATGVS